MTLLALAEYIVIPLCFFLLGRVFWMVFDTRDRMERIEKKLNGDISLEGEYRDESQR
jgi:hypothetical protein